MAKRGRKPGYASHLRKFPQGSKRVRVPANWPDVEAMTGALEIVRSIVTDIEAEHAEKAAANANGLSNRDEKVADLIAELRIAAPEIFVDYDA